MNSQSADVITLCPVGMVRNEIKTPFLKGDAQGLTMQGNPQKVKEHIQQVKNNLSRIEIRPALDGLLDGIEHYSHLVIIYWAHKVPEVNRAVTRVHPMGCKENPKVGIFSTGSPVRPNPILTTAVELVAKENNILTVKGLDAVDQSPVLDIKPYVREFYPRGKPRIPEWMARIIEAVDL